MSRIGGSWSGLAAVLATATIIFHAAGAPAGEGGGGGPSIELRYYVDDDADEAKAEASPSGFASFDPLALAKFKFSFTLSQPAQLADTHEEINGPLDLDGLYAGYSTGPSLNVRFTYRFPCLTGAEERAEAPRPSYALWANDDVADSLTSGEESDPNPTEAGRIDREKYFNVMRKRRGVARSWLGDEAYNQLRRQFGPTIGGFAVKNISAWNETHLYRGGACDAAGY